MSDISNATLPPMIAPRRRGPATRRRLNIDGKLWQPRDELAEEIGISGRTAARKFKTHTRYIGNVAYVEREGALRELVAPPRAMRRGRRPISTKP